MDVRLSLGHTTVNTAGTKQKGNKMRITNAECDAILEGVDGNASKWARKVDELICAIQGHDEIEFIDDEE